MLLRDVILTLFGVYLFTVPFNLVCVKLSGLATKIDILIKKAYSAKKTNKRKSWRRLEQRGLPCSVMVWMNWNDGSSMSGAVLNSRFWMRLLTSGEEDFEHVSVLKEDTLSTAYEWTMLVLSIYVTFTVTCLSVSSLITKSCQQRWPIQYCSFYKVVH